MDNLTKDKIQKLIDSNPVMVFMKGTKLMPQCGFSNNVVQILNSSFKGIDARIPIEMQKKGKQTLQILAESNERLASLYIKTEKPEVAVPLLVETIRIMSPNSPEGKEAYERLIQLGFVETKYKG